MLLRESDREAVRNIFSGLRNPVKMVLGTLRPSPLIVPGRKECPSCSTTEALLRELSEIHPSVELEVREEENPDQPTPAIVLEGEEAGSVRFLGLPEGHEFASLLDAIRRVSGEGLTLEDSTREALVGLRRPAHIRVFTTPT